MTTPTIIEVSAYIASKRPEWPNAFVTWYSEKFWNHYQASGWKLSSNVAMKDWKAAFNSNWQELKWDAQAKLIELQGNKKPISSIEVMFENFKKGLIDKQGMADSYKGLRAMGVLNFTKDEINNLVAWAGNNKEYGRYLSVKLYFTKKMKDDRDRSNSMAGAETGGTI